MIKDFLPNQLGIGFEVKRICQIVESRFFYVSRLAEICNDSGHGFWVFWNQSKNVLKRVAGDAV